jgi:hypothetical protein
MILLGKIFFAIFLFCVLGVIVATFFWALPDFRDLETCNLEAPLKAFVVFLFIIAFIIIIGFAILLIWLVGWIK